jgi:tRNA G26 N,N-dimethylase Trm1
MAVLSLLFLAPGSSRAHCRQSQKAAMRKLNCRIVSSDEMEECVIRGLVGHSAKKCAKIEPPNKLGTAQESFLPLDAGSDQHYHIRDKAETSRGLTEQKTKN